MSPLFLQTQHVSSFQSADMSAHSKDLQFAFGPRTRLTLSGPFVKTRLYKRTGRAVPLSALNEVAANENPKTGHSETSPSAWIIRRHHDCDGRHRWRGNLRESFRGGASCSHTVFNPRRLGAGRPHGNVWRVYLGRARHASAGNRRPVSLFARSIPSFGCVCVWMGTAARHADRRHGRSGGYLLILLSRAHGGGLERRRDRTDPFFSRALRCRTPTNRLVARTTPLL